MANFFQGQSDWDKAYSKAEWNYLSTDTSELSRQALVASLVPIYGGPGTHSILELGSGEGMLCRFIDQKSKYLGVDISADAVSTAQKLYPGRHFQQGNIGLSSFTSSLLTADIAYDHIILNEVLYYLSDEETATLCDFLTKATEKWNDPMVTISICRTDTCAVHHGSYYWSLLFDLLKHVASLEIADQKHRWDIKSFRGLREPRENS